MFQVNDSIDSCGQLFQPEQRFLLLKGNAIQIAAIYCKWFSLAGRACTVNRNTLCNVAVQFLFSTSVTGIEHYTFPKEKRPIIVRWTNGT